MRQIPELHKVQGVVVALSINGWMNEELTKDWVKRCWGSGGDCLYGMHISVT